MASPEHTHHKPLSGCKPQWPRWEHKSVTVLLPSYIPFSFPVYLFSSSLQLVHSASICSAVAGAASWACRCCWSHWSAVQQLANPPKLLSCNARVHLPFCLLQPPVGFFKILYIYIFGRKSANPKQCCVNSAVTLW